MFEDAHSLPSDAEILADILAWDRDLEDLFDEERCLALADVIDTDDDEVEPDPDDMDDIEYEGEE